MEYQVIPVHGLLWAIFSDGPDGKHRAVPVIGAVVYARPYASHGDFGTVLVPARNGKVVEARDQKAFVRVVADALLTDAQRRELGIGAGIYPPLERAA